MGDNKPSTTRESQIGNEDQPRHRRSHHSHQRHNRASYNSWASQRRRVSADASYPANDLTNGTDNTHGLPASNRPEFTTPEPLNPASNRGSPNSSVGLNGITQLLDNIDSSLPELSDTNISSDAHRLNHREYEGSGNSRSTNSNSGQGVRARPRRRHQPSGAGGQSRSNNHATSSIQSNPSRSPTSPSRQGRSNPNRSRHNGNIQPLRFGSLQSSSDSSHEDQAVSGTRPRIRPIQASNSSFAGILQGQGTETEPFELSPESPDVPNSPTALPFGPDGLAGGLNLGDSSPIRGGFNFHRRRNRGGGGRSGASQDHYGHGRFGSRNSRTEGGNAIVSPSRSTGRAEDPDITGLSPPAPISDEELARRLQEEEWEAASNPGLDDEDMDALGLLRSLDSPVHLFGEYHRRRMRGNLPPLPTREGGQAGSADISRSEDHSPFFYDGPPRRMIGRGRRGGRGGRPYLSPIHQIMMLPELQELGQASLPFGLDLDSLRTWFDMEEAMLLNLGNQDESGNGEDYEALLALAERIGEVSRGLSQTDINKLPTSKHKSTVSDDPGGAAASSSPDQLQCHICLSEYENGDEKRLLPCKHEFHKDCVDTWLKSNATCPVCRSDIKSKRS